MKQVEIFGDSILKGVTYVASQGRYRLCEDNKFTSLLSKGISVCNHSHMGATITKGISMLERQGDYTGHPIVLLEYGGNDCDFDWQQISDNPSGSFLPHTPEKEFLDKYRHAIRLAESKGARVALMSLIPIDAQKYFRWITRGRNADNILGWLGDVSMLSRWQEHYSHLVEQLAQEQGYPLVNVRGEFLLSHRFSDLLCADGIHPTQEGHDLIARQIEGYLATA